VKYLVELVVTQSHFGIIVSAVAADIGLGFGSLSTVERHASQPDIPLRSAGPKTIPVCCTADIAACYAGACCRLRQHRTGIGLSR
jgi:hypothetical protein